MKIKKLQHRFVKNIPDQIEEGILYISLSFCIAIHKCVCGCANEVSTPLSPVGWELRFDGTVSLSPSIGNWNFPCKSHYFLINNTIIEASKWSKSKIKAVKQTDKDEINAYYRKKNKNK